MAARLQELGFRTAKIGEVNVDPNTRRRTNRNSTIFRYDDPDGQTVHFVRVDEYGHDTNPAFAGAQPHYHVDSVDSTQPSIDRHGNVRTDASGDPITQDQRYEEGYEPAAVTYDETHTRVDRPGSGGPNPAADNGEWAQKTHQPMGDAAPANPPPGSSAPGGAGS